MWPYNGKISIACKQSYDYMYPIIIISLQIIMVPLCIVGVAGVPSLPGGFGVLLDLGPL